MMELLGNYLQNWDYTKLKESFDSITGSIVSRRAQHVLIFDPSTGEPVSFSGGSGTPIANPAPGQFSISGDFKTVTTALQPLTTTSRLCKAVQIQSVRQNLSDNVGRIGLGNENGWLVAIGPMGVQQFEAPTNGVLDLADIYFVGTNVGDQIVYMVMELD